MTPNNTATNPFDTVNQNAMNLVPDFFDISYLDGGCKLQFAGCRYSAIMLSLYSLSCKTKKEKSLIAGYVVGCRLQIRISAFHKVTSRPEVSITTGSGSKYNLVSRFSFLPVSLAP